ncbi:hypothetical protein GCM10009559_13130 [Pseudonocardia zijingensis]|uniref:Uncharacterized protein n=1 Tax=Pseudonocardia zijingensis TaxID=153376 RepID=A0ABP3ZX23_9PSEU
MADDDPLDAGRARRGHQHVDLVGEQVPAVEHGLLGGDDVEHVARLGQERVVLGQYRERLVRAQRQRARGELAVVVIVVELDVRAGGDRREPDDPAAERQYELGGVRVEPAHRAVHGDAAVDLDRQLRQPRVL